MAEEDLRKAQKLSNDHAMRTYLVDCHLGMAALGACREDKQGASAHVQSAQALAEELHCHLRDCALAVALQKWPREPAAPASSRLRAKR